MVRLWEQRSLNAQRFATRSFRRQARGIILKTLVIAYPDENCLRDLIAGPSILSAGFTSREEAMARLVGSMLEPRALKQQRRPILTWFNVRLNRDSQLGSGLRKNHRIAYRILQCTLSTITVLFYSRNLFSVMLRIALGFSS